MRNRTTINKDEDDHRPALKNNPFDEYIERAELQCTRCKGLIMPKLPNTDEQWKGSFHYLKGHGEMFAWGEQYTSRLENVLKYRVANHRCEGVFIDSNCSISEAELMPEYLEATKEPEPFADCKAEVQTGGFMVGGWALNVATGHLFQVMTKEECDTLIRNFQAGQDHIIRY